MHVWVMQQVLAPGVQNAEKADGGPEMFGIGGDLQQGVRAGLEKQAVDLLLVLQGERGQFVRQSEDDMEVAHRQHFGLPFGDPAVAGRRLTLGAVAIAAGVIGDGLMPALGTLVAMYGPRRARAVPCPPRSPSRLRPLWKSLSHGSWLSSLPRCRC